MQRQVADRAAEEQRSRGAEEKCEKRDVVQEAKDRDSRSLPDSGSQPGSRGPIAIMDLDIYLYLCTYSISILSILHCP